MQPPNAPLRVVIPSNALPVGVGPWDGRESTTVLPSQGVHRELAARLACALLPPLSRDLVSMGPGESGPCGVLTSHISRDLKIRFKAYAVVMR